MFTTPVLSPPPLLVSFLSAVVTLCEPCFAHIPIMLSGYTLTKLAGLLSNVDWLELIPAIVYGGAEEFEIAHSLSPALMVISTSCVFLGANLFTISCMIGWALIVKKAVGVRLVHGLRRRRW